jgi:predicted NAD/FAD-dependent oxidoreductase
MTDVAIIGSGISGLSCARRLADAGVQVVVFDKGRGIGGRVATRRAEGGLQFDHGAQHITATDPGFQGVLDAAHAAGALEPWHVTDLPDTSVGTPGMTGFAKFLARGIGVQQNAEVTAVLRGDDMWHVVVGGDAHAFDRVVCTAPAPQSFALLHHHLLDAESVSDVVYDPCLTLMVALKTDVDLPDAAKSPASAFAWVARDSAKPGRPASTCWVVQATADWSGKHLEKTKEEFCDLMLDLFLHHARLSADDVIYATAHRWRHALVAKPLGHPFVRDATRTLYAGGDWCLGPRVEHAWQSGTAIADDVLAGL